MFKLGQSNGDTIHIKGADIYYEIHGNSDGIPLLLLHGGLGSIADLNSFAHALPSQFQLIGIDFRGHGRSTLGTASLSYEQYQEDVEAVLAHLNIESVVIIGFSDGGIVGYRLGATSSIQVLGLATLGAQWRLLPDDPALPMLQGMTSEKWTIIFPDAVEEYKKINPNPDFDTLVKAVVSLWIDMNESGYPHESVKAIQSPVLIIRGDNDHLFSLEEASLLRDRITNSSFLNIPFAGHAAYEDSPELFIKGINIFLESLTASNKK